MSETAQRVSARHAVTIGAAALIVMLLRPPQPFLAILAALLLLSRPPGGMPGRIAAAWLGVGVGCLLSMLFPQQPWLMLPAFGACIVVALTWAARREDAGGFLLIAIGLGAALPAGLSNPEMALQAGWFHGWNLCIGIVCAWLGYLFVPSPPGGHPPGQTLSIPSATLVAVITMAAVVVAAILEPISGVILVIAAITTALGANQSPAHLDQKALGAVVGAALAVAFDAIVSASAAPGLLFLLGLPATAAVLAACMGRWSARAAGFAQCCAMFVVAAPTTPGPDATLGPMGSRVTAVLAGFLVAAAIHAAAALLRRQAPAAIHPPK